MEVRTMNDAERLKEMSKVLRESADALDEAVSAVEAGDNVKAEDAIGKYVMRLLRLQALQEG